MYQLTDTELIRDGVPVLSYTSKTQVNKCWHLFVGTRRVYAISMAKLSNDEPAPTAVTPPPAKKPARGKSAK